MRTLLLKTMVVVLAGYALPAVAEDKMVTLLVPEMSCPACPTSVKRALVRVDGVKNVEIRSDVREAVVKYDTAKASVDDLIDMVALAGYPATIKRVPR